MKLAIISDTHDNLATLAKAVNWMNKNGIEEIIHCGDICSPDTLQWLAENFSGKIHLVLGNVDDNQSAIEKIAGENPNIILYGEIGEIILFESPPSHKATEDKKIAFAHRPKIARALAESGKYDLVFYGHTHQPWEETINNCRLINPGNLSNMLYKATFAIYDSKADKLELKILESI